MAIVSGFPVKAKLGPMEDQQAIYTQIEVSEHLIFVREAGTSTVKCRFRSLMRR